MPDPKCKVAVETCVKDDALTVAGEIIVVSRRTFVGESVKHWDCEAHRGAQRQAPAMDGGDFRVQCRRAGTSGV